ncbi:prolyl oligopeptidase family serine peptidase [Thermopolyspora sp. NPDC052614]|uniref:S9 family peptidase n=1 Tax=Thermopolyspora sp. NPDC052614 TaxID=3155682 RepID=UPI00343C6BF3
MASESNRLAVRAYETAEKLLRHNRANLVKRSKVTPRWLDGGERFWYAVDTEEGKRFVLVDPEAGTRRDAFDHVRLAARLAEASGQEVSARALPFSAIALSGGAAGGTAYDMVEFDAFGPHWRCSLETYLCEKSEAAPPGNPLEVVAPDGRHAVYRSGHNLRVRLPDGLGERALTSDGTPDQDYGANPDALMYSTLLTRLGLPHMPPAVAWSPDSTRILTHRTDLRGVRRTHLLRSAPTDGGPPETLSLRSAHPGDDRLPLAEFVVIDVVTGSLVRARAEPVPMPLLSPIFSRWAWWAPDGSAVYYLSTSRDARTLSLNRLDPESGAVRTVMSETGATRVEPSQRQLGRPMVRVLSGGDEVLWYSQRDGWGHLYLCAAESGKPITQVTSGPWAVQEIVHVDEERRVVFFTAAGLVEEDPYRRSVCRADLDGSGFARITDDELDHVITVPPGGRYFVDSASTTGTPPVITVRAWDGRVLVELERADVTGLRATGWSPPERIRTTAADGRTEIYGLLYRPHDFDPERRYPVVDTPYGLPTDTRVSPSFDPGAYGYEAEALAALGFVVVAIDGRGSPGRSKSFHDVSYGDLGDAAGLSDHVAALRELAGTRPWMDLGRVGVTGMSGGGFAAVRALLKYPEMFSVAVAESGMHDFRFVDLGLAEPYHGPVAEADYVAASNVELADRLQGRLLLVHGGLDDRVSPHLTLRLAERLIRADKDFDLLIVPDADHIYCGYEHHVTRRRWDFLVRHLLGVEPPAGYRLSPVPIDMEALAGFFG